MARAYGYGYGELLREKKRLAKERAERVKAASEKYYLQNSAYSQAQWTSGSTNLTAFLQPTPGTPQPPPKKTAVDWLRGRVSEITSTAFSEVAT